MADFSGKNEGKLVEWRKRWADVCNACLEAHGIEERIDHRSHAERGLGLLPTVHEGYAVRAIEERAKREAEKEGREYAPVTERRRVNVRRRRINRRLRRIMEEIREIVMSRLEEAKSQRAKRSAQRQAAQRRAERGGLWQL